jgi:hypothetical protein
MLARMQAQAVGRGNKNAAALVLRPSGGDWRIGRVMLVEAIRRGQFIVYFNWLSARIDDGRRAALKTSNEIW